MEKILVINKKQAATKFLLYILIVVLGTLPVSQFIVRAQEQPVSSPVELPISAPQTSDEQAITPEENTALDNARNKFEGFSDEQINDATAKVKESLIVPANDDFFVVKFKDRASADRVSQEVAPQNVIPNRYTSLLGDDVRLIKIDNDTNKVDQMTRFNLDDSVQYVETNQIVKKEAWTVTSTTATPNDFNATNHWNYVKTKLPEEYKTQGCSAGANCGGSSSVLVAVLDTGAAFETNTGATYREYLGGSSSIDRTPLNFTPAPELNGINIWTNPSEDYNGGDEDGNFICDDLHGADMIAVVDNLSLLNASQWSDDCTAGTSWVEKEGHPNDDDGHGTFVTGMIASLADNSSSSFGAAFKTTIMPVKVLDYTGTGTTYTISLGIRYAVNKGAKIINISIAGLTSPSATLEDAISYAHDAGVVIIIASGNQNLSSLEYPAAYTNSYENVIAVGASTTSNTRAGYSSYGSGLDLVAPVGEVQSTGNAIFGQTFNDADAWGPPTAPTPITSRNFTTYTNKYWLGTSFAAPQVTATAAMMKAFRPDLSFRIKTLIQTSAADIGAAGYDTQTGYGLLNVKAAVDAAIIDEGDFPSSATKITSVVYNSRIYQVAKSQSDRIYIRNYNGSTWSQWRFTNGDTPGNVSMIVYNSKMYMTIRGGSGSIFTNVFDGVSYSGWQLSGGITPGEISSVLYSNKLYQTIRGKSTNIYIRSFDGSNWTGWSQMGGETPGEISMASYNGNIYMTIRGKSGSIFTNVFNGNSFTGWVLSGGETPGEISSIVYNNQIYQAIRGKSTAIFTRSFNGSGWTGWISNGGETPGEINMAVFNNQLYLAIRGGSSNIFVNKFNGDGWTGWIMADGATPGEVPMVVYNSRLYQFIRGGSTNIYTRYNDGSVWSGWQFISGSIDRT